jgi:hypothetical protein
MMLDVKFTHPATEKLFLDQGFRSVFFRVQECPTEEGKKNILSFFAQGIITTEEVEHVSIEEIQYAIKMTEDTRVYLLARFVEEFYLSGNLQDALAGMNAAGWYTTKDELFRTLHSVAQSLTWEFEDIYAEELEKAENESAE